MGAQNSLLGEDDIERPFQSLLLCRRAEQPARPVDLLLLELEVLVSDRHVHVLTYREHGLEARPSSTARRRRRVSYVSTSSGTAAQRPRSVISTGCRVARTSAITSLARRLISVTGVKPGTATCYSGITSAGRRVLAASDSDRLSGQRLCPPRQPFAEK